jgi:hypothetical protein
MRRCGFELRDCGVPNSGRGFGDNMGREIRNCTVGPEPQQQVKSTEQNFLAVDTCESREAMILKIKNKKRTTCSNSNRWKASEPRGRLW